VKRYVVRRMTVEARGSRSGLKFISEINNVKLPLIDIV